MWNNEEEFNENGEPVKLYVPANGPPRRNDLAAADSHIGGFSSSALMDNSDPPVCSNCQESMFLLVQLHFKRIRAKNDESSSSSSSSFVDRTVCVFGCPKDACFRKISFDSNGFCNYNAAASSGIMCCRTVETPSMSLDQPAVPVAPPKSSWYTSDDDNDDDSNDADNDWGISATEDGGLSSLENAVAAMEANLEDGSLVKSKQQQQPQKASAKTDAVSASSSQTSFDCYLLKMEREPIPPRQVMEADDVGLSASDDKIRNMLARYMAEEEDETILAALRGTEMGGGIEEDERLTEEDRTLLGFQDRIRRSPRQVVRYAPGGVPLWSIPSDDPKTGNTLWEKPTCACGAQCVFEFQLLPQLLLFLQVDKYAGPTVATAPSAGGGIDKGSIGNMLSTGMNWGSVAVFSCPEKCGNANCGIVIQKSVDQDPALSQHFHDDDNDDDDNMMDGPVAVVEDLDDDAEFEPDA